MSRMPTPPKGAQRFQWPSIVAPAWLTGHHRNPCLVGRRGAGVDEPTHAERELAARRRDLEREFDDKARELKAQHKRQADKLQADRLDWEASRKAQLKDLADRTERVKRQEENHRRDVAALKATQAELGKTRERLQENEGAKVEAKQAVAEQANAQRDLARARSLLAFATWVAVGGGAASLLGAALWDRAVAYVAAGLTLALGLLCEVQRRRLRRAA